MLDFIAMQMSKVNREKGYFIHKYSHHIANGHRRTSLKVAEHSIQVPMPNSP